MKLFIPDNYSHDIYSIPYEKLKKNNIKCLLFDLDNTCVGYHEKNPNERLKNLFIKLKKMGFKVIIFSNATKKRLEPFQELSVICHPMSKKPLKLNFKKIIKKYNYQKEEICIIGDQIFTDILGGNRVGIKTYLIDPLTNEDFIITKMFRQLEKRIIKRMKNKGELQWKNA